MRRPRPSILVPPTNHKETAADENGSAPAAGTDGPSPTSAARRPCGHGAAQRSGHGCWANIRNSTPVQSGQVTAAGGVPKAGPARGRCRPALSLQEKSTRPTPSSRPSLRPPSRSHSHASLKLQAQLEIAPPSHPSPTRPGGPPLHTLAAPHPDRTPAAQDAGTAPRMQGSQVWMAEAGGDERRMEKRRSPTQPT